MIRSRLARRKPLSGRSPIKRAKPLQSRKRSRPARVGHFWDSIPDHCQACWELGVTRLEPVLHHLLAEVPGKVSRRDDMLVVKLCPPCHNMSRISVHGLGSEAAYERETGVDLVAIAVANRAAWERKLADG